MMPSSCSSLSRSFPCVHYWKTCKQIPARKKLRTAWGYEFEHLEIHSISIAPLMWLQACKIVHTSSRNNLRSDSILLILQKALVVMRVDLRQRSIQQNRVSVRQRHHMSLRHMLQKPHEIVWRWLLRLMSARATHVRRLRQRRCRACSCIACQCVNNYSKSSRSKMRF